MSGRIILLRHPEVARIWAGRCYGRSDMGLSRDGAAMAREIVAGLSTRLITRVVHSDMRRTRPIAAAVARDADCPLAADARWRERDFGCWEGMAWEEVWRKTGSAMDGMMTDPHGFRPGGGETSAEMSARALEAWRDLPRTGVTLVVAHGGTIAAIRTMVTGDPMRRMVDHVPRPGALVEMLDDQADDRSTSTAEAVWRPV